MLTEGTVVVLECVFSEGLNPSDGWLLTAPNPEALIWTVLLGVAGLFAPI